MGHFDVEEGWWVVDWLAGQSGSWLLDELFAVGLWWVGEGEAVGWFPLVDLPVPDEVGDPIEF